MAAIIVLVHMVKNHKKITQSFTLIEILVVLSIVTLFTGFNITNYYNYNQESSLKKEVQKFVDVLSLAEGKTQTSDINFVCSDEFGGYRVEISAANYSFKQCCRDTVSKIISSCGITIQSYNFPSNINKISGAATIDFFPLSGGSTNAVIRIKNSSINKCLDISISNNGVITTGDTVSC